MDDQQTTGTSRRIRLRKLRIAWSVAWGIACLLMIALWVRSYWWMDGATWQFSQAHSITSVSLHGRMTVRMVKETNTSVFVSGSDAASNDPGLLWQDSWHYIRNPVYQLVLFPHWFLAGIFAAFAALPMFRWQFSLCTLLIVTTLVAVGLGWIVYAIR